jgi:hypothetical protein
MREARYEAAKESRLKDVSLELSIRSGRLSSLESVEHKKRAAQAALFLCFYRQGRHSPSSPIYVPEAVSWYAQRWAQ